MTSNNSNYNPEIDLSIIVPVYNEEQLVAKNITEIISVFSNKQIEFEIIIVDDGSSDDSLTICKKFQDKFDRIIHILCNQQNRGYTSAIKRGIEFSRGEYISYLDVDLQYDPQDLLLFYFIATKTKYHLITGKTNKSSYSVFRRIVSLSHNLFVRFLFKNITRCDINSIKLFSRFILEHNEILAFKETIGIQLILASQIFNPSILSVPIDVRRRKKGKSKFKLSLIKHGIINTIKLKKYFKPLNKDKPKILLTFDLEEWRMPEHYNRVSLHNANFQFSIDGTYILLKMLKERNITCTFFTTGYFAENNPKVLKDIIDMGHEISSHSYYDRSLSRHKEKDDLSNDIEESIRLLESITKTKILGFRAPQFSKNKYLFDVLHDNILYDSSIHPAFLPGKYIDYHNPLVPHIIKKKHKYLLEIPCSVFPILRIPISWWWMRNIGLWLTLYGTTSNLKRRNNVVLYFHPWEFTEIRERTVPLHITRYTGKKILRDLEKFIHYFQSKGYNFSTIKSLYIK